MSSLETYFSELRAQFPAVEQKVYGKRLAYLDSAATSLKPRVLADRMHQYYLLETANVHRGAHYLADQGTRHFEEARQTVAKFLNCTSSDEIIFVKGCTEGINLVAHSYAGEFLKSGDEILITDLEHHANIVPWQMIAEKKNLKLKIARALDTGELDLEDFKKKLEGSVKLVAVTGCSNTLGVRTPINEMMKLSHAKGAKVLLDVAQLITQQKIDVQALNCDFLVFSGHKIFGPTGIGVLYGKKSLLDSMPPYQGGGSMISEVCFPQTTYNDVPFRFEAGTPHIAGVIGLKTALDFFSAIDITMIAAWEDQLLHQAENELSKIQGIALYGQAADKGPIISFNLKGLHHSDVSSIMDREGVAVRAGHHCTQPLMARMGIAGTLRASFSIYNNAQDIDQLVSSVKKAQEMLT